MVSGSGTGETWDKIAVPDDEKIDLIGKFVAAVEHLHGLGVSHGDIHTWQCDIWRHRAVLFFLIDIPDFHRPVTNLKITVTALNTLDNCTSFERDNYAVMKMSCELLGMSWGWNQTFIRQSRCYPSRAGRSGFWVC